MRLAIRLSAAVAFSFRPKGLQRPRLVPAATAAILLSVAGTAGAAYNVNVGVDVNSALAAMPATGLGNNVSVYTPNFLHPSVPGLLIDGGVQLMRYPGGSYSDLYHWSTHSVSPPYDGNQAAGTEFGNYINMLDQTGMAGMVTVNYGSSLQTTMGGQPEEAAAWVAYANAEAGILGTPSDVTIGTDLEGNDWHTAGFWSRLRASTPAEYQAWATPLGLYNSQYDFLAIDHDQPAGIKYWEIGNEIGGNGYWGPIWEFDLHAPYPNGDDHDNTGRVGNPLLSPTAYATNSLEFVSKMRAVDPTVKIGVGLEAPATNSGNQEILTIIGDQIDFGIVHWYVNNGSSQTVLMNAVDNLPSVIQSVRDDFAAYTSKGPDDYEIHVTEFGFFGTVPNPSYTALFDADAYATMLEQDVTSVDFWEFEKSPYFGRGTPHPAEAYYAIQMMDHMLNTGDEFVEATSSVDTYLKAHAVQRPDGTVALLLINERRGSSYNATVTVNLNGPQLQSTGEMYVYGWDERALNAPPSMSVLNNLGNSFTVTVLDTEMAVIILHPVAPALPGDYNGDDVVDAADYTVWRDHLGEWTALPNDPTPGTVGPEDYDVWKAHFGQTLGSGSAAAVPEPSGWLLIGTALAALAALGRRRLCVRPL